MFDSSSLLADTSGLTGGIGTWFDVGGGVPLATALIAASGVPFA